MYSLSQLLCRLQKPTPPKLSKALGRHLSMGVCVLLSLMNGMDRLAAQTQPNANPLSNATVETPLMGSAKDWMAKRLGVLASEVHINPMDERLKVLPCEGNTQFDQPFANPHVIRARCEQPKWQFFLQATWSAEVNASNAKPNSNPSGSTANAHPSVTTPLVTGKDLTWNPPMAHGNANSPPSTNSTVPATPLPNAVVKPGNSEVVRNVLVLMQPLKKGSSLNASYFKTTSRTVSASDAQVLSQVQEIENMELLHDMGTDQMIHTFDVKPSVLVKRGQEVTLVFGQGRGFMISVKTEALQDGTLGEQVRLKNVESGRIITGVVTGLSEAKAL